MKTRLVFEKFAHTYYAVRNSYWLVPGLMATGGIVLAVVTVWLSARYDARLQENLGPWSVIRPAGARAILATIAGSMITIAGVTFSVTTLAVSHATSNYGPRLFANFLKDRGSQVTLGTFVAAFVFCVAVLAIVSDGDGQQLFVPHLALFVAFLLALASVAMLIFFVQHAQQSLYVAEIIATLGARLARRVDKTFPRSIAQGESAPAASALPPVVQEVLAERSGYLQHIGGDTLIQFAREADCIVRLRCAPGDFVLQGAIVAEILADNAEPRDAATVVDALEFGSDKTTEQDSMFIVNQLAQVAIRSLSPGINDPFTANTCIDWLVAYLGLLGERREPSGARSDKDGVLRLIAPPITFDDAANHALDQLRPHACRSYGTLLHALPLLAALQRQTGGTDMGVVIARHVERWLATIVEADWTSTDRERLGEIATACFGRSL